MSSKLQLISPDFLRPHHIEFAGIIFQPASFTTIPGTLAGIGIQAIMKSSEKLH